VDISEKTPEIIISRSKDTHIIYSLCKLIIEYLDIILISHDSQAILIALFGNKIGKIAYLTFPDSLFEVSFVDDVCAHLLSDRL
jgi:hypothetical protein